MASYSLNEAAVAKARSLIDADQYVLDSDWGDVQPSTDQQSAYVELAAHELLQHLDTTSA